MRVPENKRYRSALFQAGYSAVIVMLSLPSYADAAEWAVRPRLNLRETYTDNVTFRPEGSEISDFVTQINPGFSLTGVGRRFNVSANYLMNNLIYAEATNFTRTRHRLNARANAELVEDFFFVEGRSAITQQNISIAGPQAIDNVNVTGNRADVRTLSVSPYLRHRFKNFAVAELRYAHSIVSSSANTLRNSQGDSFLARLDSGNDFNKFKWGVNYSNQMVHFDRSDRTIELERSIVNVQYMFTPQFGLTGTGGYERNSFISIKGSPSSPIWTAGFTWTPSERTSVVANAGQRFFGDTYYALARHRTRLSVWDLSYNENITTFNQQALFGSGFNVGDSLSQLLAAQNPNLNPGIIQQHSDALLGPDFSGSFFGPSNFLTNRLFLQKRLQASVALNGARNTIVLRGFNMTREAYSPESADAELIGETNAALLRHTRQTGGNATWIYRISQLTSANLNLGYTRFAFLNTDREDDLRILRLSITKRFPHILPNLNGMIQLRRNERDSNRVGADYRENAIIASLNMSF
ncbi:TIGR03016 family PEP-CTERM system-associated outer membrane protein [Nitrosovibrio sp. Nv6]|uniref:TIGR03016 family PEP-CTERM system-associated outer membrane protein n=1 Tax=Nitrosovibrio sp. Nv6 TaxID=1855340 RepID=UPI0008BD061B|nr:TIGR03016 family PEP-CTERM system-associated outer membrane protein [Nitrosovibrio sp. Nv6]SEP27342.1 uncharacterized protein, PEP-CTERM system associated [Nitrosovibrio sp. Nv6]